MRKKFIIICSVLLAATCSILPGCSTLEPKEKQEKEALTIVSLSEDEIEEFSYWYKKEKITFLKEDGIWYKADKKAAEASNDGHVLNTIDGSNEYEADKSIRIAQDMIADMLSAAVMITPKEQLTDTANRTQYGFEDPKNIISLKTDQEEVTITIGMWEEETNQCYIMVTDDIYMYVVKDTIYTLFQQSVAELTENK